MDRLLPFSKYSLNEKWASFFNKFGKKYIKGYWERITTLINIGHIKEENIKQVSHDEVVKRIYNDPKYVIFVCGNMTEYNPKYDYNKPESESNPRELKYYGIRCIVKGLEVHRFDGYFSQKKPSRKQALESNYYDYFVIDTTGTESIFNMRNSRWNAKNGAWLNKKGTKVPQSQIDEYERNANKQRYLEAKKKKLNVDDLFDKLQHLFEEYQKIEMMRITYYKYLTRLNESKDMSFPSETYIQKVKNFTKDHKVDIDVLDKVRDTNDLIVAITKKLHEIKTENVQHESSYVKINVLKDAIDMIKLPDYSHVEEWITKNKWMDSKKLSKTNDTTGVMD